MQIVCRNCGSVDDYTTELKSNNLTATCNTCGRWIKNIPQDKPRMYVGKYKDKAIEEIDDLSYLQWAYNSMTSISGRVKQAIGERINSLSNLLR